MRLLTRVLAPVAVVATALVATSVPALAATKYTVTVTLDRSEAQVGQSVTVSGKVTGGTVKGKSVTVYRKPAADELGPWKKIGTTTLDSKGRYAKKVKLTDGGPTIFRVIKPAGSGKKSGVAYSGALDVYQWQYLSRYKQTATYDGATVNGNPTRGALLVKTGTTADFTTSDGGCKRFRGTFGIDDDSVASYGQGGLIDGIFSIFATVTVARGTAGRNLDVSLSPDHDLSVAAQFPSNPSDPQNTNTLVVLGAQVYCNAPS